MIHRLECDLILKQDTAGEAIESVIGLCLRSDPAKRPNCDRVDSYLTDLSEIIARRHDELRLPAANSISAIDDSSSIISSTHF